MRQARPGQLDLKVNMRVLCKLGPAAVIGYLGCPDRLASKWDFTTSFISCNERGPCSEALSHVEVIET